MNEQPQDSMKTLAAKAQNLLQKGNARKALTVTHQILAKQPDHIPALTLETNALLALQNQEAALNTARRTLELDPHNISQLINLSLAYQALGNIEDCLATIDQLLAIAPQRIESYIDKSALLLEQDRYPEALKIIEQGLMIAPRQPQLLINQGTALLGLERYQEALTITDTALSFFGKEDNLSINRVLALSGLRRFEEALTQAKVIPGITEDDGGLLEAVIEELATTTDYPAIRALLDKVSSHDPRYRQRLYRCCARCCFDQDRLDEALAICQTLMTDNNADRDDSILYLYGRTLARLTRFEEANQVLQQAYRCNRSKTSGNQTGVPSDHPMDTYIPPPIAEREYVNWELERHEQGDWSRWQSFLSRLPEIVQSQLDREEPPPLGTYSALHLPLPQLLIHTMAQTFSRHIDGYMRRRYPNVSYSFSDRKSRDKIRIGYVSADFRNHATSHLMQGLFRLHDRNRFEIISYSLQRDDGSEYRRQIAANCDRFIDLTTLSNAAAVRRIHGDNIDILVDLMGFTRHARPEIFALRPAPVQVSYLGYPGTLGADCMHYIVVDPQVLPSQLLPFFSEQPVYLPDCYQVNHRQAIAETGIRRADVGLPEKIFVFCCFNRSKKIEPAVFTVWMRLLYEVPDSVLWLLEQTDSFSENLRREAKKQGIEEERIIFAPKLEKSRHLERHRLADLFLDTFIYNAHTTASDALWAGLPVLTLRGDAFQARVAASLLTAIGLPELITNTTEEYEQRALYLATHQNVLHEIRNKLQRNRLSQPLFDTESFARHLESAFEAMWGHHAAGQKPQPIYVDRLSRPLT